MRGPLALAIVLAGSVGSALGHGRSVSYSRWTLGAGDTAVEVRVAALDATLSGADPWSELPVVASYVAAHVLASREGVRCPAGVPQATLSEDGVVQVHVPFACSGGAPDTIGSRLFEERAPSHLHFARIVDGGGEVRERVLTAAAPLWVLGASDGAAARVTAASLADYVRLGLEHIRTGYDHLSFVMALLLLATSLPEVTGIVTAFTIAHSVTLAAAVLGLVHPSAAAVEALIGFSIALVAIENGWILGGFDRWTPWLVVGALVLAAIAAPGQVGSLALLGVAGFAGCHAGLLRRSDRPARLRALVAFGFGLIHGFGFAGVLAEVELPRARLVPALVGFNVGVELGQLAVVVVGWTLLVAVDRVAAGARRRVAELGSAAILALGLFWFLTRGWA